MKKTIKILLLAVLVVCTVCVLTVMASATGSNVTSGPVDGVEGDGEGNINDLVWKIEETTLTISGDANKIAWAGGKNAAYSNYSSLIPWLKGSDTDNTITKVVIDAPIIELPQYIFYKHRTLKSVTLPQSCTEIASSAFTGCRSLSEIKIRGNVYPADAVIDLRGMTSVNGYAFDSAIADGTTIWMPSNIKDFVKFGYTANYTYNFVVYEDSDAEKKVDALKTNTNVKGTIEKSYYLKNSIVSEGWSVCYGETNGLRGVFYADSEKRKVNSDWELADYGVLLVSQKYLFENDVEVSYNKDDGVKTSDAHGNKVRLFPVGEGENGENLLTSNGPNVRFTVTIKNYSVKEANYYNDEVYMAGYEVWTKGDDYEIIFTDCGTEEWSRFASLYEVSLASYKRGIANANVDPYETVWDSLVAGGALVLNEETDYTVDEGVTDMDGNPFGGTFTVANVSMVNQTIVDDKLTFTDAGVTYTVLDDCFNEGKYVLVFRTAEKPNEGEKYIIPGTARWGGGYDSQLATTWFDRVKVTIETDRPNPVFITDFYSVCETVIIDHGITGIAKEAFAYSKGVSYMYYDTLKTLESGVWMGTSTVNKIYRVINENGIIESPEEGLADISTLESVTTGSLFDGCAKITKIHMPDSVNFKNSFGNNFARNTKLDTLWCGDDKNRIDGAINLSNISLNSSIGKGAFNAAPTLTGENKITIWLPEGYNGTRHAEACSDSYGFETWPVGDEVTKACWSGFCVM